MKFLSDKLLPFSFGAGIDEPAFFHRIVGRPWGEGDDAADGVDLL